jgi:hypothetical protein
MSLDGAVSEAQVHIWLETLAKHPDELRDAAGFHDFAEGCRVLPVTLVVSVTTVFGQHFVIIENCTFRHLCCR